MIFNLFNLIFFSSLLLLVRLLPTKFHNRLFILAGIIFCLHHSPLALLILLLLSLILHIVKTNYAQKTFCRHHSFLVPFWLTMSLLLISYGILHFCLLLFPPPSLLGFSNFYIRDGFFLIGLIGLVRFFFLCTHFLRHSDTDFNCTMAYFWYPCIMFSGPAEFFEDFTTKRSKPKFSKHGLLLIFSALIRAFVAEQFFLFSNPANINIYTNDWQIIRHFFACFWVVHFRLSSYLYFTRGFSCLYGINFDRPLFQKCFSATSPLQFFSRWNMATARFIGRYFLTATANIKTGPMFISFFSLWMIFGTFGRSSDPDIWQRVIFASMWAVPISGELLLRRLRCIYPSLTKLRLPGCIANPLTIIYVHVLYAIGSENGALLSERFREVIKGLLPAMVNIFSTYGF